MNKNEIDFFVYFITGVLTGAFFTAAAFFKWAKYFGY